MTSKATDILLQAVAVMVLCFSLTLAVSEVSQRIMAREFFGSPDAALGTVSRLPEMNRVAAQANLLRCIDRLNPVAYSLMTATMQGRVFEDCRQHAEFVQRLWPTDARVHLVFAGLAARTGRADATVLALAKAKETSAFEGWMTATRLVGLLGAPYQTLLPDLHQVWEDLVISDVGTLLTTDKGADLVAAWYVRRSDLRAVLSQAIDEAATHDRHRVLTRIRIRGRV